MRRVWDAFCFSDELDLLEARLTELDDTVYRHVLVEAPVTFQGNPKPLHYAENAERFAPWKDKIIHVVADLEGCEDHWAREHASRDATGGGLGELGDEDIFLLGDVDEIPFPGIVQHAPGTILMMRQHLLAVNLVEPHPVAGPLVTLGCDASQALRRFRDRHKGDDRPFLRNVVGFALVGAWHFSWLGGPDAMRAKVRSFSHPEYAAMIDACADDMYRDRLSPFGGNRLLEVVIDETFPKYMRERRGPANWYWPGP